MLQLRGQALVESDGARLGAVIVDYGGDSHVGGHTSYSDNVAVVPLDHGGHELLHHQEVGEGVDLEGPADGSLGLVEDGHGVANSGVVDQNGGLAMVLADLRSSGCDLSGGCDIDLVEVDAACEG